MLHVSGYVACLQEGDVEPANFAKKRLQLSQSLYYKLLDAIMRDEEKRHQEVSSLQVLRF